MTYSKLQFSIFLLLDVRMPSFLCERWLAALPAACVPVPCVSFCVCVCVCTHVESMLSAFPYCSSPSF